MATTVTAEKAIAWSQERVWDFLTNGRNGDVGVSLFSEGHVQWTISKTETYPNYFVVKHHGGKVYGLVRVDEDDKQDGGINNGGLFDLIGGLYTIEEGEGTYDMYTKTRFRFASISDLQRGVLSRTAPWARQPRAVVTMFMGFEGDQMLERHCRYELLQ